MKHEDLFATSSQSLRANTSRSLLTILGIVIGVAAVILMLSIGQSAEGLILNEVADLGSNLVFAEPSAGDPTEGPPDPFIEQTITLDDVEALEESEYFSSVSGMLVSSVPVDYGEGSEFAQVEGVHASYLDVFPADLVYGRFIDIGDVESYARVAVLGNELADTYFGDQDPVGKKIKVDDVSIRVIGVFEEQGSRFFQNLDKRIWIPITTAQRDVFGLDHVSFIAAIASGDIELAKEEAKFILRAEHNIDNPEQDPNKDDFFVSSQSDAEEVIGVVGAVLSILLASIAAISLIVGGIGIMNIMLVSVTERTREIGLRKAIGATRKEILEQFLLEAVLLTLIGGLAGILIGIGLSLLIGFAAGFFVEGWQAHIPMSGIILGLTVSMLVGIVFGVYPARRAAAMDPIEALRYE